MARELDLGEKIVAGIRETLAVEDEWSIEAERGFTWWPHGLRQRVWAGAAIDDHDMTVYRINVVTDLLREVGADRAEASRVLAPLAGVATAAATVFDPQERTLRLWTAATAHAEIAGEMTRLLGAFAALQAAEAAAGAGRLAAQLRAMPDTSAHPRSGARAATSAGVQDVEAHCLRAGVQRSPWLGGGEIELAQDLLHQANAFASIDDTGMTAELPFGQDTSLMTLALDGRHPRLGNGLELSLVVPAWGSEGDTAQLAATINRAETTMRIAGYLFGSWGVRAFGPNHAPVFNSFVPAALHRRGTLVNMVLSMALRAEWMTEMLKPDEASADVAQLIAQRARQLRADD
ncbi:MAG: hypothetical protein AB7K86_20310 [Rhodospirillales bacterium]